MCRWWAEIEVLIVTSATTANVEANNTAINYIKGAARGCRNPANHKSRIFLRSAAPMQHEHSSQQTIPREP
ncbi:transposase [Arthrobacter rhizosphaerae]|uniref:transposase n=1 Tax=Arthrobacter rhizosphaerae TaxID=2855490 RepID=UPI003558E0C1